VFWGQTEGCLVHRIARAESEEDPFWKLVGECCEGLGYDGRVASDHVCYCDSDSDPSGPRGYCGKSRDRFWRSCSFCPVEQMIVYEDTVEALFLTELCTLDDVPKGLVGREKDPATELN